MATCKLFRFFITIALFSLSLATAYADEPTPQELIVGVSNKLENELFSQSESLKDNPQLTIELIEKHLVPNINFPLMSRYVLGKNWRKINAEQKKEFISLFHSLLVKFYSKAFVTYLQTNSINKGMIKFMPFRGKSGSKYATVKSKLTQKRNAPPIDVHYQLYNGKTKGWKVYDINVEGISLVTSYRSSFNKLIKQKGMQGLLGDLQEKIDKLNQKI